MQKEFALFSRFSLCVAVSVLAACGGDGTKPEWSQVVYTDVPLQVTDEDHEQPYYVYPIAQSVMPQVLASTAGYGFPLTIEKADYTRDLQFLTLDITGKVKSRNSVLQISDELHRTASGLWVQDAFEQVTALDADGKMLWQRQITTDDAANSTGDKADFVSARRTWRNNIGTPGRIETLTLTGLAADGSIVWQQAHSFSTSTSYDPYSWIFAHDDQGQVCFINPVESPQLVQCVNHDGGPGSTYATQAAGWKTIDLSNQRIGVISKESDQYTIELFDRDTGFLQSSSFKGSLWGGEMDTEFSSDGQFHVTYQGMLRTVSGDGHESVSEFMSVPDHLDYYEPFFSSSVGRLSADALGNVYVLSEARGTGVANGTSYRTVRSVVTRRSANGAMSNVVLGHLSKYRYEKNGECIKRCWGFPGAKVLTDIAAQPDGRLITAWADSSVGLLVGDLGTGGLVPFRRSVIVASYAPAASSQRQ